MLGVLCPAFYKMLFYFAEAKFFLKIIDNKILVDTILTRVHIGAYEMASWKE